jgi:hypothetical protein
MTAEEIASAFNAFNDRKTWSARAMNTSEAGTVFFHGTSNMVVLSLDVATMTFSAKFVKFVAAWGDYVTGISRSLFVVLNTLKAAGLPIEAPTSPDNYEVTITAIGQSADARVAWRDGVMILPPLDVRAFEELAANIAALGDSARSVTSVLDMAEPEPEQGLSIL